MQTSVSDDWTSRGQKFRDAVLKRDVLYNFGFKSITRVYFSATLSKLLTYLTNTSKFLIPSCYQRCLFTDQWTCSNDEAPFHIAIVVQKWFKGNKINVLE